MKSRSELFEDALFEPFRPDVGGTKMITSRPVKITLQIVLGLGLLFLLPARAQRPYDYKGEVFAGYSHLDLKPGEELENTGLSGWHVSMTGYATEWLGFAADVSGHYGTAAAPPNIGGIASLDLEQVSYLFGPRIRVLRTQRFATSMHALLGASRRDADPDTFVIEDLALRLSIKQTKFAAAFGAAFDVNLTPRVAWRAVQPDFFLTTFSGERRKNFRISTGIIFRFGYL